MELCDDPDRSVRTQAWMIVRQLKLKKALPVLEARLGRDHLGFCRFTARLARGHDQGAEGRTAQTSKQELRTGKGHDHRRA